MADQGLLNLTKSEISLGEELNGPVAQLVERLHGMEEVRGSNPLRSTTSKMNLDFVRARWTCAAFS
jgi:hypothetical protein